MIETAEISDMGSVLESQHSVNLQDTEIRSALPENQITDLQNDLQQFVLHQQHTFLRPICLVSSGGTAVDLEINSVRCIDNFSTGLRGAISVEEFLKRGYAVIHLQREGSTSPFARIVSQCIGLKQSNHSLTTASLGQLFTLKCDESDDDNIVQTVLEHDNEDNENGTTC